jgi:capsular exopolysaccharide synthesis family protein
VARLQLDPPGTEVFALQGGGGAGNDAEYIATQAQNLQSDELAAMVVHKLRLDTDPDFAGRPDPAKAPAKPFTADGKSATPAENAALKSLKARTAVTRDSSSHLVNVSVGAHDPLKAANVTNTLIDLFIERDFELRHEAVQQSSQWLQKQLDDIRSRMDKATRALADFQKGSGIAAIGDSQNTFTERMNELNRQMMQAQADRIQLQSYLRRFDGNASSSLPQISGNPVVQNLTTRLAEARAELAQNLAIYGKNHPIAKKLQNQVDELQTQLTAQREAIVHDLNTSYSAAQARESLMKSQMDGANQQLALVAQYSALKKEADASTELYNTLFSRIKEAGINAESKSSPIRIVDRARVLDVPTRPHRKTNLAIGLLAALIGGIVLAFIRESMDTTIHTADDVRKCIGTGSVAVVPMIGGTPQGRLLASRSSRRPMAHIFLRDRPNSPEAEALRGLYTSVRLSRREQPQVLLVASPLPGEGKTTLSVNLAIALAQHGRACIVDADLRKEGVAAAFKVSTERGLAQVLSGQSSVDDAVVPVPDIPNLNLLAAGSVPVDPATLITSAAMADVVRDLRARYEFVLIDCSPVLPFADGRALSTLVDGVLLVGRSGVTRRENLSRAVELLEEVHSAPIQVVLNAAQYTAKEYGHYYSYGTHGHNNAA